MRGTDEESVGAIGGAFAIWVWARWSKLIEVRWTQEFEGLRYFRLFLFGGAAGGKHGSGGVGLTLGVVPWARLGGRDGRGRLALPG